MPLDLFSVFKRSAVLTTGSAALNLASTILIVRAFGSTIYADQIVDLAKLSLVMTVLEIIPSAFIVFKIQDKEEWLAIFSVQLLVCCAILVPIVHALSYSDHHFSANTPLISIYAALLVSKRYIDTVLQSQGIVHRLFALDCLEAITRLILLMFFALIHIDPKSAVWLSLVVATTASQLIGLYQLRQILRKSFTSITFGSCWQELHREAPIILRYYPSVFLKKLSEAIVPLIAEKILKEKNLLAIFLLAFRGLNFVLVFGRIYEAILNHRGSLSKYEQNGSSSLRLIAALSQLTALGLSIVLIGLSGLEMPTVTFLIILTANVWPAMFTAKNRALRFSKYEPGRVAVSYLIYTIILVTVAPLGNVIAPESLSLFALCILLANIIRYYAIRG
jgi:hypothetical protein